MSTPAQRSGLMRICAAAGQVDRVRQLLLSGVDPNSFDGRENTSLMEASANGHADVVKILLATDGINVDQHSDDGATALLFGAFGGTWHED